MEDWKSVLPRLEALLPPLGEMKEALENSSVAVLATLIVTFAGASWAAWKLLHDWRAKRRQRRRAENSLRLDPKHRGKPADNAGQGIESLQYARQQDVFRGVERDVLLQAFADDFLNFEAPLDDGNAFRWTLLYGEAGSGKSRFALELLRQLEEKQRRWWRKLPKFRGFLERDPDDADLTLGEDRIRAWEIDAPAVIVLDYAGASRKLRVALKTLRDHARERKQYIRLILLERRNDGGGLSMLRSAATEESHIGDTYFGVARGLQGGEFGVELKPLSKDECLQIMKARIERTRALSPAETDDWLLERLEDICTERQPLYAALVGAVLAESPPQQGETLYRLRKRDELLGLLVKRDRDKYWRVPDPSNARNEAWQLGLHENLLALATFCRGLPRSVLDEAERNRDLRIPKREEFDNTRYSRMATDHDGTTTRRELGYLEPDFIGEWFVLSRIQPGARGDDVLANAPDKAAFLSAGWSYGKERAAQFLRQCHQNHPDPVDALDYLLPEEGTHIEYVAQLLRDLLFDWRISLNDPKLGDDAPADQMHEARRLVTRRATEAFDLLRRHVDNAGAMDQATAMNVADAVESFIYIRSWMICPTLRQGKDYRHTLGSLGMTELGTKRAPLATSHALQDIFARKEASSAENLRGKLGDASGMFHDGPRVAAAIRALSAAARKDPSTRSSPLMTRCCPRTWTSRPATFSRTWPSRPGS